MPISFFSVTCGKPEEPSQPLPLILLVTLVVLQEIFAEKVAEEATETSAFFTHKHSNDTKCFLGSIYVYIPVSVLSSPASLNLALPNSCLTFSSNSFLMLSFSPAKKFAPWKLTVTFVGSTFTCNWKFSNF